MKDKPVKKDVIVEANANFHHLDGEDLFEREDRRVAEYRKKWREWPETFTVGGFPLFIDVEVTSSCNLRCEFCATTFRGSRINRGFIPEAAVKKIIDEGSEKGLC